MNKIRFILGEDKHLKLLVRSPNDEPFTILTASYELARYTDIVVQGECDINDHYLDCKIAPKEKGTHVLLIIRMTIHTIIRYLIPEQQSR